MAFAINYVFVTPDRTLQPPDQAANPFTVLPEGWTVYKANFDDSLATGNADYEFRIPLRCNGPTASDTVGCVGELVTADSILAGLPAGLGVDSAVAKQTWYSSASATGYGAGRIEIDFPSNTVDSIWVGLVARLSSDFELNAFDQLKWLYCTPENGTAFWWMELRDDATTKPDVFQIIGTRHQATNGTDFASRGSNDGWLNDQLVFQGGSGQSWPPSDTTTLVLDTWVVYEWLILPNAVGGATSNGGTMLVVQDGDTLVNRDDQWLPDEFNRCFIEGTYGGSGSPPSTDIEAHYAAFWVGVPN